MNTRGHPKGKRCRGPKWLAPRPCSRPMQMRLRRRWGFRTHPRKRRVSLFWLLPYSLRLTKLTVLIFFLIQEGFYGPNTAPQPHQKQPSSTRKKSSTLDQKRNAGRLSGNTVVLNSSASSSSKKSRMTLCATGTPLRVRSQSDSLTMGSWPLEVQGLLRPVRSQGCRGTVEKGKGWKEAAA